MTVLESGIKRASIDIPCYITQLIILFSTRKGNPSSSYDTESQEPDDVLYDPGIRDLNLEDNDMAAYRSAMTSIGRSARRSNQVVKVR